MSAPTLLMPPTVIIHAHHYLPGTRFWDVMAAYRKLGYHVRWQNFRLVATRLN